MKRTTTFLTLSAVAIFALLSLNSSSTSNIQQHVDVVEFSANPPSGKTGAPGESTCTDCHSGTAVSATGSVTFDFDFGGTATDYIPGQTYPMQISVASGAKNGFQMTILNASNQKAGDFVNGTNTSTVLAGGKEYIRHSSSSGISSFDFEWTAPSSNVGDVRVYYTFNKTNNNGANSGDVIYFGNALIPTGTPVSIGGFDENPNQIKTYWDASARQIHLDYALTEDSKIVVNIQSLSGQLVQSTTLGYQDEGQYHQTLAADNITPGIYIVAVFVNNRVFDYKMLLN